MPPIANDTCGNGTTVAPSNDKDDLNALLYIVVTLLFYSMGIIIGIITYLKREQAEMEEDKMFEMYLQLKREPFNLHKKERVQQMAMYLKQMEERREARERVENWRTAEGQPPPPQQQHHLPSCRHHSPFLPGSEAWSSGHHAVIPPGVSDTEWAETGGGPALLCSLTLGVCEPLLTPETIKRVAFPDVPSTDIDPRSVGYGHQAMPRCQCGSIKSAFKSSSPVKISSAIKKTAIGAQVVCPEQCKECPDIFKMETPINNDPCDINRVDIQILDPALPVFQKCSLFLNSPGMGGEETFLSPRQRSMSFACSEIARAGMARKLSLDLQSTLTGRCGQLSPLQRNEARSLQHLLLLSPSPNEENLKMATFPNNDKPACVRCAEHSTTPDVSNDTLTESNADEGSRSPKDSQMAPPAERAGIRHLSPAPLIWPVAAAPKQQTIVYSIPLPEPKIPTSEPPTTLPIQLALFLTPSQIDARPKIFPLTDIPKSVSLDESIDGGVVAEDSSKRRLQNPKYDAWRRGQHKTVDIPDMSRSLPQQDAPSKLAVHHGKRSLPRNHQPTRDNERRGALFFTQKALHKENDSPKQGPAGAQRQARHVGLLGRQESVDSSNSRNSDLSDSPLLQAGGNDGSTVLNLSSASSSAGSTSMSPPAPSKHQGRIPRLVKSHTEETSKLLKK